MKCQERNEITPYFYPPNTSVSFWILLTQIIIYQIIHQIYVLHNIRPHFSLFIVCNRTILNNQCAIFINI